MRHKPEDYPLMSTAHVIVGCDSEIAQKLYFSKEAALLGVSAHFYIAFFDQSGEKIGEVRIDDVENGQPDEVVFEDEY
jgi:sensor histidine kinase regulating citrate/malate metabolism